MSIPNELGHLAMQINFLPKGKPRWHKQVLKLGPLDPSPTLCCRATWALHPPHLGEELISTYCEVFTSFNPTMNKTCLFTCQVL